MLASARRAAHPDTMRYLAIGLVLTACGGTEIAHDTPEEAFVHAACRHVGCPGWPTDVATCEPSWTMAVAKWDEDAACLEHATAELDGASCKEASVAADAVVDGQCKR